MDNTNTIKIVENGLVIIVLFIIIIILYKPLTNMIEKVKIQSAQESTRETINMTKNYYMSLNLNEYVKLPLKIVFNEKSYKTYSNGIEYIPLKHIKIKGKLPESGSVEIKQNGEIEISNLKFGKYICNRINNSNEECIKEQ